MRRGLAWNAAWMGAWAGLAGGALTIAYVDLNRRAGALETELVAVAFLNPEIPDERAAELARELPAQDPEIRSVKVVTRSEALERAQEDASMSRALVLLRNNPFPASLEIHYSRQAWRDRPEVASAFKTVDEVIEVRWPVFTVSAWRELLRYQTAIARTSAGMVVLVFGMAIAGLLAQRKGHSPRDVFAALGWAMAGSGIALAVLMTAAGGSGLWPAGREWLQWLAAPFLTGGVAGMGVFRYKTPDES